MDIHINRPRQKTQNSQLYEKLLEDQYQISQQNQSKSFQNQNEFNQDKIQMIVDLGNNNNTSIMVGKNDDANNLAKRFCFKYNIDPRVITTLANNIKKLQMANFSQNYRDSMYKIERNQQYFDDKQNMNSGNEIERQRKSYKRSDGSQSRMSRTKTGYSNYNDSLNISNTQSRVNQNNSNTNRYNVFQRLYKDSRKKQLYRQIESSTNKKNHSINLNTSNNIKSLNQTSLQVCLNIYDKNTKLKQQTIKKNQDLCQLKKQKQIQQCKFKPQINQLSSIIATKLRQMDESGIGHQSNNKQLTKIKEYLMKKQQQEMKQCTFKPKIINRISNQPLSSSSERFIQLHQDFNLREAKRKKNSQDKNKNNQKQNQPIINKLSQTMIKKDFFERLQEDKQKRLQKIESKQKQKSKSVQKRPSTGRGPINRNLGEKTIGEYLYQKSKNSRCLTTKQPPKILLADAKSSRIYNESKRIAFEYIFQLLDSDQDGLISSTKINISSFGQQILRLLAPLLSQMEEVNVELNQQEFIQAFDRLFHTFSVAQKNYLLKFYKTKNMNNQISLYSFQPSLNQKSLIIARQLCEGQADIYEASMSKLKEKQEKLNRKRAERMLEQYSQCTFHPRINF